MKKLIPLLTLALTLPLSPSFAQDTVTSVNAVGMIKTTLESGQTAFVSYPFVIDSENPVYVHDVFSTLPSGSQVFVWNSDLQNYTIVTRFPFGWSSTTTEIAVGAGIFVIPTEAHEVVISGEVPGTITFSEIVIPVKQGFNGIAFPYPVETTIENSGINAIATSGDTVSVWNNAEQRYDIATKFPFGWSPANTVIPPGVAAFYFTNQPTPAAITTTAPYTWPNN